MTATRERCKRGHRLREGDTYADGSCKKCASNKRDYRTRRHALKEPSEYVPNLRPYREARGFTVRDVAKEARMDVKLYRALEGCEAEATYEERVKLYRALVALGNLTREEEDRMKERERRERVAKAGLA